MRIIFNLINCGCGNNGGTSTIVKSANTLQDLGHEVYIIDSMKNQHTWTKLKVPHIIIRKEKQIPDSDIIIATGYNTVKSTVQTPSRCGLKAHWIRGLETWTMSEQQIKNEILNAPTIKLVNSICLKNKLKQFGVDSEIIRPGNDFEELYPMDIRKNNNKVILGGLYHTRHKTKRSGWVISTARLLKEKYNDIELHMFGTNKNPNNIVIDKYLSQPNVVEKNKFFNKVGIWLAPSKLEGLHIVPQEAMLTECIAVATDTKMSGTSDYMMHGINGYVAQNNIDSFIKFVEDLYRHPVARKHMGVSARKKIIELGSRKENMQKLVDLTSGII